MTSKAPRLLSLVSAIVLLISGAILSFLMIQEQPTKTNCDILNERGASMSTADFLRLSAVNLNRADAKELQGLPGIGKVLSQQIVNYRNEHGTFASVDDLLRIKGIGKNTIRLLHETAYVKNKID